MMKFLRRHPSMNAWLLLAPALIWLLAFFVVPLFIVVSYSFLERGTYGGVIGQFTLENIQRVFDPLYLSTFLRSVYIALLTTFFCLLIGYPLGYFIATRPPQRRNTLLLALMIPFWTNFLIRTYAWLTLLRTNTGLINVSLMSLGIIDEPLPLLATTFRLYWDWCTAGCRIWCCRSLLPSTAWMWACWKLPAIYTHRAAAFSGG